jgi:Ca2+-binding EF-hand superfamily protein
LEYVDSKIKRLKDALTKDRCDKLIELARLIKTKICQQQSQPDSIVSLTYPEFETILTSCGLQHLGTRAFFDLLDLDMNSQIDYRELTLLLCMSGMFTDVEIAENYSFNILDTNGDGQISNDELRSALGNITFIDRSENGGGAFLQRITSGSDEITRLFEYIRENCSDGNISKTQFALFFTQNGEGIEDTYHRHAHAFLTATSLRR